jgi:hypothetical protein
MNPCREIKLPVAIEPCQLGFLCIACGKQIVGLSDGICGRCLQFPLFGQDTNPYLVIGQVMEGRFYCLDCASWFHGLYRQFDVAALELGFNSQICTLCRRVVMAGRVPRPAFPCEYERSVRVIP